MNRLKSRSPGPFFLCILGMTLPVSALLWAQDDTGNSQESVLEEVLVTAERRTERLLDVPLSVTAITEQHLIDINATNFVDYAQGVPSVSWVEDGRHARHGLQPVIRGLAVIGGRFGTTAMYFGEVPVQPSNTRLGVVDPNLFDIERVEILRGPQGDLYGSSSMGGAIKIVPKHPEVDAFNGAVDVRIGTYESGSQTGLISGMVNFPLSESAALRVVATYGKDGGYIDAIPYETTSDFTTAVKDRNSYDTRAVRAALRWQVTDNLIITPSFQAQREEADSLNYVSGTLTPMYGSGIDIDYGVDEEGYTSKFSLGNLEVNYDLGWATLLSSTTVFDVTRAGNYGATGILAALLGGAVVPSVIADTEEEEHFVQEFRLTSTADWPIEFTAGLFYRDMTYRLAQLLENPALAGITPGGLLFSRQNEDSPATEKAAYGRATWHVSDKWEVAAGVRYSEYDVRTFIPTTLGPLGYPTIESEFSTDDINPSLSVRYAPNDDLSLYGRIASGSRPGFSIAVTYPPPCFPDLEELGIDPSQDSQIEPDNLWNYEVGFKGRLLNGRLAANLSVYRIDWTDLQLSIGLSCGFSVLGNAGNVRSEGVELETEMLVTESFLARLAFGYNDATTTEDIPALGGTAGDRLPGVPKVAFALGGEYRWTVASLPAYARLDYAYQGASYNNFAGIETGRKPSTGLLSGRLGVRRGDFEFALYGRNLLNEDQLNICSGENFRVVSPDYGTCMLRPRELGIQLRWIPESL